MKGKVLVLLIVLILLGGYMFAAGEQEGASEDGKIFTIATDPLGSGTYGCTAGLGKILNEYGTYNIKIKPTTGATEVGPLLAFGEVEFGIMQNYESQKCWLTDLHYDEPLKDLKVAPMRVIMGGAPTWVSAVVAEDSGIRTGSDLKGCRYVGVYTGSTSGKLQSEGVLNNFGLTTDDVTIITVPGWSEAIEALIEGRADVAGSSTPGQAILKELEAKRGAMFLSLNDDPASVKAYQDCFPAKMVTLTPAPDLTGIKGTTNMMAFEDFLIANADKVSDTVAYNVTKTLYENLEALMEVHVNLSRLTVDSFVSGGVTVPYHPGAIKYYKEVGVWTPEAEALNNELLAKEKELLR